MIGDDDAIWHEGYGSTGWLSLGGAAASAPALASSGPGAVDIFVQGIDRALWYSTGGLGDGTYQVGADIAPGTYRMRSDAREGCYWARLAGFSGQLADIIANDFTTFHDVVTIAPTDAGFTTSGCGGWTRDLSPLTGFTNGPIASGMWMVGVDLASGTWQAAGGPSCYWERLAGFSGQFSQLIANAFGVSNPIVQVAGGDAGFTTSDCGTWIRTG